MKICVGELDEAEALIGECTELAVRHADAALHACAASNQAIVALLRGDLGRTVDVLDDALRRNELLVDRRGLIENLLVAGAAAVCVAQPERGLALHAAAVRLHEQIGFQLSPGERVLIDTYLGPALVAAADGQAAHAEAVAGRLDLTGAVGYARETLATVADSVSAKRQLSVGLP
jgi:ATP/maltotriose-dependent transcriptional regulator MalT